MKNNRTLAIAIGVVILVVVLGAIFLTPKDQLAEPAVTPAIIDTSSWQTYRDESIGFEFKYPVSFKQYI